VIEGRSGATLTYGQLEERANRFAHVLRDRGLRSGDHIAILMENNLEYLEVTWAAQRAGCYYTAINSHLRDAEVRYILEDCGAQLIVTSPSCAKGIDLSGVRDRLTLGESTDGFESYHEALASGAPSPIEDEREGQEMLYSSGTTGRPKGIRRVLPAVAPGDPDAPAARMVPFMETALGIHAQSTFLTPAPLYHSGPLITAMATHRVGGTTVIMDRFDAAECLRVIERYRVTAGLFVPTMFVRMLRLPDHERLGPDLSSLQHVTHSAAPCPVDIKREMIEWWGPIIHEHYGATENIGGTTITPAEWLAHPGSVGRSPDPVHIVDERGNECPPGVVGTVYFEGGEPFEYHGDPEKTARVADARGWRTVWDIGYLDSEGFLYLTDRAANMIISGGVNIYPQESENVLWSHPAVADVAVFGVPDPDMGEVATARVQLVDPAAASPDLAEKLLAVCRESLASYKCPRTLEFVDTLPRDANGKLYKRLLTR
jgi:acyl-CoA synthetase (AMP-forming)/AMP-acid ligase II